LYDQPTLGTLAQLIIQAQQQRSAAEIFPPITPCERRGLFPLSFSQQRMWFLAQLEGISHTYHICSGLQVHGPLDIVAWQRSLNVLLTRHEALRSVFVSIEGQPHIELLPPEQSMPFIKHDLRGAPDAEAQ